MDPADVDAEGDADAGLQFREGVPDSDSKNLKVIDCSATALDIF